MIIKFITTIYFIEFVLLIVLIDFFLSLIAYIFPFLRKYLHIALAISGRLYIFFSGCRMEAEDKFNIDKKKTYLIVSNHQSIFDIFAIYSIFYSLQFKWFIKKSLFYTPFFGTLLHVADYIPINRKDKYSSIAAIKKAINSINNKTSVVIFPEGTRSLSETIMEFKPGSMVIAARTGVDILPVVLKNTLNIYGKKSLVINPLPIKAKVLKPIKTKGLSEKKMKDFLPGLRKMMLKEYSKL